MVATIGKVSTKDAVVTSNAAQCFGMTIVDDLGQSVCIAVRASGPGGSQQSKIQAKIFDIEQVTAPVGKYTGDFTSFDAAGGFTWNITASSSQFPYIQALGLGSMNAKLHTRAAGKVRAAGRIR